MAGSKCSAMTAATRSRHPSRAVHLIRSPRSWAAPLIARVPRTGWRPCGCSGRCAWGRDGRDSPGSAAGRSRGWRDNSRRSDAACAAVPPAIQHARRRQPGGSSPTVGSAADVQEDEAKTRGFLARLFASTTAIVVLAAGGWGLITENYMAVIGVWSVAGPIVGALVTYYFGPQRNDTG